MKLNVTIKTVLTQEEWVILCDASAVLDQLRILLEDYDNEFKIIDCALNHLQEVMQNVIDDYE